MKDLLKNARESKAFKTRELAHLTKIDQALISKFESGARKPTKEQITTLATVLEIDSETLMIAWLKEKILNELKDEKHALKALKLAEEEIRLLKTNSGKSVSNTLHQLLEDIDLLHLKLKHNLLENNPINQKFDLEYTHESNYIEGNTLTLLETDLVVNEGQTIAGKSMREHLEALNHQEAIAYIKNKVAENTSINSKDIIDLHKLLLRGILPKEAGIYRNINITLKDMKTSPVDPVYIPKEIEVVLDWSNKTTLHPIVVAATIKEKIMAIQPFLNANGKISRLLMNFVLLKNGYPIANIKSEEHKSSYYQTLKASLIEENKEDFIHFIARIEKENLEQHLKITNVK